MRSQLLAVLALVFGLSTSIASPPVGAQEADASRGVTVDVACPDGPSGQLVVTIDPWVYVRQQGEDADWTLTTTSADDRIEIDAKSNRWPYPDRKHAGRGRARGQRMRNNALGSYDYTVTVYCGTDKVVIDPKMKVE